MRASIAFAGLLTAAAAAPAALDARGTCYPEKCTAQLTSISQCATAYAAKGANKTDNQACWAAAKAAGVSPPTQCTGCYSISAPPSPPKGGSPGGGSPGQNGGKGGGGKGPGGQSSQSYPGSYGGSYGSSYPGSSGGSSSPGSSGGSSYPGSSGGGSSYPGSSGSGSSGGGSYGGSYGGSSGGGSY